MTAAKLRPEKRRSKPVTASSEKSANPVAGLFAGLADAGFQVTGVLAADRWDALVPPGFRSADHLAGARSVLVVASGGRALFDAFATAPEATRGQSDPLDAYTERCVEAAASGLRGAGHPAEGVFAHRAIDGHFADFVAVGEAAGLGAPSRLGLLLHPVYGPWLSIRAALLSSLSLPPTPVPRDFAPCRDCPAPCASACPGEALADAAFDVSACQATRSRVATCVLRCDARRACVVGPEHSYSEAAEAHHMAALNVAWPAPPPGRDRP